MPHIHELYDFTTSAFILHPTEEKLLLLKHRKIGKWLQPGGHVELDENPLQTLYHELDEETGLKPSDYYILQQFTQPTARKNRWLPIPFYFNEHDFNDTHKHIDLSYLLLAKTTEITSEPDGADDIQWLDRSAIHVLHQSGEVFDGTLDVCEWVFERFSDIKNNYVKITAQ